MKVCKSTFVWLAAMTLGLLSSPGDSPAPAIDRHALVSRHNVTWNDLKGTMPLGNGEFCFNADGTGLQTFGGNTMAHWAWHSFPLPPGITADQIPDTGTFQQGRPTGPDNFPKDKKALYEWMRANPHGINLGRLRLHWTDGRDITRQEVTDLSATLDLWSGELSSHFKLAGEPVSVKTCVDSSLDAVAVHIESPLLTSGKLEVTLDFPYPTLKNGPWVGDFAKNDEHMTAITFTSGHSAEVRRQIDATNYDVKIACSDGANLRSQPDPVQSPLRMAVDAGGKDTLEVVCAYSPSPINVALPSFGDVERDSAEHWAAFWKSGGAIDLSGSKDPRWFELERRIVLSQYQMAAQSSGSYPPAEDGLMGLAWVNRFHMEMIWWHLAHYALWDRWSMAEKALKVYDRFLPSAEKRAQQIGMKGAEWPKGAGPDGISLPWSGNIALLWKQPHPIFFAELDYRLHPTRETLLRWQTVVQETAENMADYATLDPATHTYSLFPDMPPSEQGPLTRNVSFDLAYWRWALGIAQKWRQRLGLAPDPHWDEVRLHLAPLPVEDGVYTISPEWHDTYTKRNDSHPDPIGMLGMLPPTEGVDPQTARQTVLKVAQVWRWDKTWGWDFPWMAMAAARTGEPQLAVDTLLSTSPTNRYDWRGINNGTYLPGNGGLLYAVAMMAAGWDGAPNKPAPGFPADGSWVVRWEDLKRAP